MHVTPVVEEPDLRVVYPSVVIVANVKGLLEIADQVNEEA